MERHGSGRWIGRRTVLRAAAAGMLAAGVARMGWVRRAEGARVSDARGWAAVTERLRAAVSGGEAPGVALLVLRNGETLYREAFGTYTFGSVIPVASASKMASSSLLMTLVDAGALSLDTMTGELLPSFIAKQASITVRQCLSHTSGLPGDDDNLGNGAITLARAVDGYAGLPLRAQPGTEFYYGGVSYAVAGRMAEVAGGAEWGELFAARIARPLGITTMRYGPGTNPRIAGGLVSSLDDYGRLLGMHLAGGDGMLSPEAVRAMQADQVRGARIAYTPVQRTKGYGLGWWWDRVDEAGNPTLISDQGAFGTTPWIDLGRGYAGVLLIQRTLQVGTRIWFDILPHIETELDGG